VKQMIYVINISHVQSRQNPRREGNKNIRKRRNEVHVEQWTCEGK
jgi:hypothetical protein